MIKIENLIKTYDTKESKVEALKGIDINIEKGEIFGIIGLSGAGKSSLVRCINLLEKPTSGKIWINGEDITVKSSKEIREMRKKIGMIFQHFNLLVNSTVYENVAFPLKISGYSKKAAAQRVDELLEIVGLTDKRNAYPSQLSGGQKQRVGIARALANDPEIILSDEATSALDPSTTESILNLLSDINERMGKTIIVITHEIDVIKKLCDRVAVLKEGKICESGSVAEVLLSPSSEDTKEIVKSSFEDSALTEYRRSGGEGKLLRIYFTGHNAEKPIVSHMVKSLDVDVNIISGTIEKIKKESMGQLLVSLTGEEENFQRAETYLKENGLRYEVLS